jgi:O-antigen ligase
LKIKLSSKLDNIEKVVVIIILLYSTGVWWHPQVQGSLTLAETIETPFSGLMSAVNFTIYPITLLLISRRWKKFFYVITRDKFLLILFGLTVVSLLWSNDPESTSKYLKGLVRVTLFGAYLATRYTLKEQIKLFAWAFGLASILSLLIVVLVPSQGLQLTSYELGEPSGWRGIYYHKNHLGRLMCFSSGTFLLLAFNTNKFQKYFWMLFCLSAFLLVCSNSKNALISLLILLLIPPMWLVLRQTFNLRMFLVNIFLLIGGGLTISITSNAESILKSMGKDTTFTGRFPLWSMLLQKAGEKPWLGYGYHGFWSTNIGDDVRRIFGWAGDAHNGFIEVFLNLGFIGLSLLLIGLLRSYYRSIAWASLFKTPEGLWPLLVLTVTIFGDLSTSPTILEPNAYWMLYVSIALALALECDRQKQKKLAELKAAERKLSQLSINRDINIVYRSGVNK